MISTIVYTGDGTTRIFPVSFEILGENYVRIYLDEVEVTDRTRYDIINNSIVFLKAYIPVAGAEVVIVVATSESDL